MHWMTIFITGALIAGTTNVFAKEASGVKITVLQAAQDSAPFPQPGQTVVVNYTGWLSNKGQLGKKFDSSIDRGVPFSFVLGTGQVIRGWDIGVKQMRVGEKARLFIPASLGYGSRGVGSIPPNSDLIFDVELLSIR